jgi:hypothetical protein
VIVGLQLLNRLYATLLRCYPSSFRAQFGAEMRAIFAEAADEAATRGWVSLAGFLLRELRDWPGALLQAHWRALRKGTMMNEKIENAAVPSDNPPALLDRYAPAPWREALLAGLPHALVALTFQAAAVATAHGLIPSASEGGSVIEIVLVAAFSLSIVAAMAIAWRRGWPRWSASWFGYAFLLLVLPLGSALQEWKMPLGSWRLMLLLPDAYIRLLVPLLLAAMLFALGLRNRSRFLLTVLPLLLLLWMPMLEFSWYPLRTVVVLVAWLGAALAAVLIARAGNVRAGAWMALALNLVVGLAYTYVPTYHAQFPPGAPAHYSLPPTFLDWLNRFAPGMLATSVVILEPLLVRRLWVLGRRSGALGTLGFRLSLVGLVLLLAADLTASWWFGSGWMSIIRAWGYGVARGLPLSVLAYVAMFLCFSGAISFGAALLRTRPSIEEGASLFLVFALVVMPLILALPIAYNLWDIRAIPKIWGYVVGLPWLALGVWLITRRSVGRVPKATV